MAIFFDSSMQIQFKYWITCLKKSYQAVYTTTGYLFPAFSNFTIFILFIFAILCILQIDMRGGYDLRNRYSVGRMCKYCLFLEDHSMYTSRKRSYTTKQALIHLLMLAMVLIPGPRLILASEEVSDEDGSMLLVLEDCDSDNKLSTEPYGDTVSLLNSRGQLIRVVARGLMITDGCGGLSVSEDGRFFAICERASNALTVYETATGIKKWSLSGFFNSAAFANGLIYATGGESIFAIDNTGTIVKHNRIGGIDIAVDNKHDCLWIVGLDIKKCGLDLQLDFKAQLTLDSTHTGGFSVDVCPDGSIWIAERNVDDEYGSKNRLVKRSLYGSILKTIDLDFSPVSLRIDRYDGSVWTTGRIKGPRDFSKIGDEWPETLDEFNDLVITKVETFTRKYDSEGNLIFEISEGGYSIELDQSDRSVWITGKKNIWHYSANGRKLSSYASSPEGQKWLAIVPGKNN